MNPKNPKIKKQPQQGEEKGKNQKFITDYEEKGNRGREKEERTLQNKQLKLEEKTQRISPKQGRNGRTSE